MNQVTQAFYWSWYSMQILWGLNGAFNRNEWDENLRNQKIGDYADNHLKRILTELQESDRNMVNKYGWNIYNQGVMTMLLYGLLVVPQQLLSNARGDNSLETDTFMVQLNTEGIFNNFKTYYIERSIKKNGPEESVERALLRHIRNSISHARFNIDTTSNTWIFEDFNNSNLSFRATISHGNLGKFIADFGRLYSIYLANNSV